MSPNLPPSPPPSTSSSPTKASHLESCILHVSSSNEVDAEYLAFKTASLTLNPSAPSTPEKQPRSSPHRLRNRSSISMSEIPAHMSAGQILPSGGLELASEFTSAQMSLDSNSSDSNSDSDSDSEEETRVPLFPHEMGHGGIYIGGRSLMEMLKAETPAVFEDDETVTAADGLLDGESDEDISGGVLISDGVYTKTDFMKGAAGAGAAEKERGHYSECKTVNSGGVAKGDPFPEYDDTVALELLKAGPKTYTLMVRCVAVAEPEYVVVDRPIGAVSRRISVGGSA